MNSAEEISGYRETLLEHARRPRNHGLGFGLSSIGECTNPLCGDHVRVGIQNETNILKAIRIEVRGCAMATASASLLSDALRGRTFAEANQLRKLFETSLLEPQETHWPALLREFLPLSHLRVSRARIPCALMAWYALKEAVGKIASGESVLAELY